MKPLIRSLASAACVTALALLTCWNAPAQTRIPDEYKTGGFALGCQAYTFNRFTIFEAIEKTAQAGGKIIEFYSNQKLAKDQPATFSHNSPEDVVRQVQESLAKHKIKAVNYGVVRLSNNETEARKVFEFARKMGMIAITIEPQMDALDLIEKLIKEYDIKAGIHNHPRKPNDANYKFWDPEYIRSILKDRDPRFGACADTGHWVRSGIKPVDALKILEGRVISSHLKDLSVFDRSGHDVPFGTGVSDIPAILDELRRQKFEGNISIEYEYNWDHSVPDIAQCVGFVRGYAAGKK